MVITLLGDMEKGELRLQEDKLERLTQMVDELEKENVHEGELESFIGVLQHVTRPIFPLTCHCITEDSKTPPLSMQSSRQT